MELNPTQKSTEEEDHYGDEENISMEGEEDMGVNEEIKPGDSIDELLSDKEKRNDMEDAEVYDDSPIEKEEFEQGETKLQENQEFVETEFEEKVRNFQPNESSRLKLENIELKNEISKLNSRVAYLESQVGSLQENFSLIIQLLKNKR